MKINFQGTTLCFKIIEIKILKTLVYQKDTAHGPNANSKYAAHDLLLTKNISFKSN